MASSSVLPPIETVPSLPTEERAKLLDLLFEPSTQLHTLSVSLLQEKTFPSYNDLIAAIGVQLTELANSPSKSDSEWLEDILVSHPRLGAKKVESVQSQAEQEQLHDSAEEAEKLRLLNVEYVMVIDRIMLSMRGTLKTIIRMLSLRSVQSFEVSPTMFKSQPGHPRQITVDPC